MITISLFAIVDEKALLLRRFYGVLGLYENYFEVLAFLICCVTLAELSSGDFPMHHSVICGLPGASA
jgi:hypothetical protein